MTRWFWFERGGVDATGNILRFWCTRQCDWTSEHFRALPGLLGGGSPTMQLSTLLLLTYIARSAAAAAAPPPPQGWLTRLLNGGYPFQRVQAIPSDFSVVVGTGPTSVPASFPLLTAALNLVDQAESAAEAAIPGLAKQIAVITGAEQGPFKLAISVQVSPQIRLSFGRAAFGIPQSKQQIVTWLEDPTQQLITDTIEFRAEFFVQNYIKYA